MDELEERLRTELRAVGREVGGSDELHRTLRRRVRRRKTVAGISAVVPIVLLLVGAVWMLGGNDEAADLDVVDTPSSTLPGEEPPPETTISPDAPSTTTGNDVTDPLRQALISLGAAVDTAPSEAVTLGVAEWCGIESVSSPNRAPDGDDPSGCLVEATETGLDAVMLRVESTIEGDPIVTVVWTLSTRLEAAVYVDSTQDAFGIPGWTALDCELTIDRANALWLTWENCHNRATDGEGALSEGVVARIDPGEPTTVVWPDGSFLQGNDAAWVFLVSDSVWGFAGIATANDDGSATLRLSVPSLAARLDHTEFGEASMTALDSGHYEIATEFGEPLRRGGDPVLVDLPAGSPGAEWDLGGVGSEIDPSTAVLGADGISGVTFGTSRSSTIAALEETFDADVVYTSFAGCATTGYATVGDFLVVEFWGDDAGSDSGFAAWYYGGTHPFDFDDQPAALADVGLTTTGGIGMGSSIPEILVVGGGFSGGYDSSWGADIWFENVNVGGSLSADITTGSAVVTGVSGGRSRTPARLVC